MTTKRHPSFNLQKTETCYAQILLNRFQYDLENHSRQNVNCCKQNNPYRPLTDAVDWGQLFALPMGDNDDMDTSDLDCLEILSHDSTKSVNVLANVE